MIAEGMIFFFSDKLNRVRQVLFGFLIVLMKIGSELERSTTQVSALELKQLSVYLCNSTDICFRFRVIGEMWMKHLMQLTAVNEKTLLLFDDVDTKYYLVKFNNIMQFEIDRRYQNFQPFYHYEVTPSPELE